MQKAHGTQRLSINGSYCYLLRMLTIKITSVSLGDRSTRSPEALGQHQGVEGAQDMCVPATPLLTMWPQASRTRRGRQPLCSHCDPRNRAGDCMWHLA